VEETRTGSEDLIDGNFRILNEEGELLTDTETGDLLEFPSKAYPKGQRGALVAAARKAGKFQKRGITVLLTGPGSFATRRYAAERAEAGRWPYQIHCPNCGGWMHANQSRTDAVCRECYKREGIPQEQKDRIAECGRRRKRSVQGGELETGEASTPTGERCAESHTGENAEEEGGRRREAAREAGDEAHGAAAVEGDAEEPEEEGGGTGEDDRRTQGAEDEGERVEHRPSGQ